MKLLLRRLKLEDETSFLRAIDRTNASDPNFTFYYVHGACFADYVHGLDEKERCIGLPDGHVPGTLLFGFVGEEIVGRLSIRHQLNDFLATIGGHIGYVTVPQFRRHGYATEMLRQALPIARSIGLTRVLLTCDEGNIGSQKTIEKCGGVYEKSILGRESERDVQKRRYWIDLKAGESEGIGS